MLSFGRCLSCYINLFTSQPYFIVNQIRCKSYNKYMDYSLVPKLDEDDLEEQHVKGSGPGGQAVNKTSNAVVLKHRPTGITVKCHQTRSACQNSTIARELLITKLDNKLNGDRSIENQQRILKIKESADRTRKRNKMLELKRAFIKREGLE